MVVARRKGVTKRAARRRSGAPAVARAAPAAPLNEEEAASAWKERGRAALSDGYSLRVSAEVDADAFAAIRAACKLHETALAERRLHPEDILGMVKVNAELRAILRPPAEPLPLQDEAEGALSPARLLDRTQQAANLVTDARASILRVCHGRTGLAIRRRFGVGKPMDHGSPASVRGACELLLAGVARYPDSAAAAILTPEDRAELGQMARDLDTGSSAAKAAKQAAVQSTVTRDVLGAAHEVFYDLFGAAISLVLRGSELERLAALELIPRREERRARRAELPAKSNAAIQGTAPAAG